MEVLVLARYCAQKEGELNLAPGDVVRQVCQGPVPGWLYGELGGHCGRFPKRVVQEIPESLRGNREPRPRYARRRRHPTKSRAPQRWCKVNFNYSPGQADELQLQIGEIVEVIKEIEDGWWLGKKNGQLGAFPSNFVELLDSGPPSLGNPDLPSISLDSQRPPKLSRLTYDSPPDYLRTASCPETYRVLYDYQPEAPDELALQKGDLVKVLRKATEDKGWWEGECQGKRGVFPDNFVLPPSPIKKLTPRIVSRESALTKEQKKLVPKTYLPTVKKLATTASGPTKTKTSSAPTGNGQKRPTRASGSNGLVLNGGPRQPGKKQSRTQVSRQQSTSSQEGEQGGLAKSPSTNKTSTPEVPPLNDKAPTSKKALIPEVTPTPDKVPTLQKTPSPKDKVATNTASPSPKKFLLPDVTLGLETFPIPDEIPTPQTPTLKDKVPTPERTLDLDQIPTAEKSLDKASAPETGLSLDEAPTQETPTKDEAPDPEIALQVDKARTPIKVLTPQQSLFEEVPSKRDTQYQHFSQEDAPQGTESRVDTKAQPQKAHELEESPQMPNSSSEVCFCELEQSKNSPTLSKSQPMCEPAAGEACSQETPTLPEAPANRGTTPQEAPSKKETPRKEQVSSQKEPPPEGEASQKQAPPEEAAPTQAIHSIKQIPDPQETLTLGPNFAENENDSEDITALKQEVGSLRRELEGLELQLKKKLSEVWEELESEREKRQLLEVQMMQQTQKSPSRDFRHADTQTQ